MKNILKSKKAIRIVISLITIVVILIFALIAINETIKKARLENLKTDMLLLQGELKGYAENAKFDGGETGTENDYFVINGIANLVSSSNDVSSKAQSAGVTDITGWYYFTNEQMESIGLKDIQSNAGDYIVKFNIEDIEVEIIYTSGYEHTDGNIYYLLSDIEEL